MTATTTTTVGWGIEPVSKATQNAFAAAALKGRIPDCLACGQSTHQAPLRGTWCYFYEKFARYWRTGKVEYSVFVKGNKKLPFWAFSSLPAFGCPGAGDCLNWCYSFKAWRYPAAYFRQLQNALLLQSEEGRQQIADRWARLPYGKTVRLYVDGDFDKSGADGLQTMKFWWHLLSTRVDLRVYGYSKSWALFLAYARTGQPFPANYRLNLSSGSIYGEAIKRQMLQLPITRGEFVAVDVSQSDIHKAPDKRENPALWAAFAKAVKQAYGEGKAFVCPGKCGDCLPEGEHACGSDKFQDIPVLIGIH
jgi:hypothetical protein